MSAKVSDQQMADRLKTQAPRQNLTPMDRLCVRLSRAQGISTSNTALINLTTPTTVVALTKGLPRPSAAGVSIGETREALRKLVAADVGLDCDVDRDMIEGLITAGCRELADRIESASQSGRGRARFGIAEAA